MKKTFALLAGLVICGLVGWQLYAMHGLNKNLQAMQQAPFGNVLGDPQGAITIVEFVDYRCTHCAELNERLTAALSDTSGVRVVVRPLPWLGQESAQVARLALAAGEQGKDILLHNAIMRAGGVKTYDEARGIAQDTGIDMTRADATMKDPDLNRQLGQNVVYTEALHIKTLPALLLHTKIVAPASEADIPTAAQLRAMIADIQGKK